MAKEFKKLEYTGGAQGCYRDLKIQYMGTKNISPTPFKTRLQGNFLSKILELGNSKIVSCLYAAHRSPTLVVDQWFPTFTTSSASQGFWEL